MCLRNLVVLYSLLLIISIIGTSMARANGITDSSSVDRYNNYDEIPCNVTTSHGQREISLFCPSIYNTNLTIDIHLEEEMKVSCLTKDIDLTALTIYVGEIKGFESKSCNLVNRLWRVFNQWQIQNTKQWDITGFSDVDFVLTRRQFQNLNLSSITDIRIRYSNIVAVEPDTFYDFVSLETINLNSNKIKDFPDLFKYSMSLHSLEFSGNELETLPNTLTAPSLKGFLFWANNITTINENFFVNATEVTTLELSKNNIEFLPDKLIYPLVNLEQINLSRNKFKKLPENFFKMNKHLKVVRLSDVNMSEIHGNTFAGLSNLTTLQLEMNLLETLPENLFANMFGLKRIWLWNNRLKMLPQNLFRDLRNLSELNLSHNQLSEWSYELSANLKKLRVLYLSGNNLTKIKSDYFYGLNLTSLDLSRNKISYIDPGTFNYLNLETLNLSQNNLSEPDSGPSFIDGLKFANILKLDHNSFETLNDNIQFKTRKLYISHNKIRSIAVASLRFFLEDVFLNDNQIEIIDFSEMNLLMALNETIKNKVRIYIDNNPIRCGCEAFNLIEFFDGTYKYQTIYNQFSLEGEIKCQMPSQMAGRDVAQLKSENFTCDYTQLYQCPTECSCLMHPKYQSFNVSCTNARLRIPPVMPTFVQKLYGFMFSIKRLMVDLRNNSIVNFTKRDSSYVNVSDLYLSNNELNLVNWVPPRLAILELNDNELENLEYGAISVLNDSTTLKRLTLHDNKWNCNCKLLNLTKLIKLKNFQIPFDDKIFCSNGKKVLQMTESILCVLENQVALISIGVCFFLFLIMIGVALVLYYKYEYHVKVWLYSKPLFMRFVAEEDLDKDKVYDAFLSYSHKDEDFIVKELLPVLENGPEPYKLCIHIRDWIVGEFITKQIVDSVESSRRTIIVLSPHFLKSEWATMEFRTAHTQAMREGRHRLIVILYGDIDPNAIEDEDLRTYLSTNTYVKWGDPWFWKKLKYVLPHRKSDRCQNNNYSDGSSKQKRSKGRKMENIMVTIDKMDLITSPATPNLGTPPAVSLDPLLIKGSALNYKMNPSTETPPAESGLITTVNN